MSQQRTSITKLLPIVSYGGLYVIEDLQTSFDALNSGNTFKSTTLGLIADLVEDVQKRAPSKKTLFGDRINSFEVGKNICFFLC